MMIRHKFLVSALLLALLAGCTSMKETQAVKEKGFQPADISAYNIAGRIPDYSSRLSTVKGKGKALVSEPDNSDRATIYFSSNKQKSLITIKNSIGIEGGKLLTDGDTLLVYNKVDHYARKISVHSTQLDDINNLASVNILQILNRPVDAEDITNVLENEQTYLLHLESGTEIYVDKSDGLIQQIDEPRSSAVPYSRIIYDAYDEIKGLQLPRRITIFSADETAKVDLLIQSLEINPKLDELKIDLPDGIKIYRQ